MKHNRKKPYKLTKSGYLAGLQCDKKLWKQQNSTPGEEVMPSLSTLQRFETGRKVGAFARNQLKGGIYVNFPDPQDAVNYTQKLIDRKTPIIFEAAFLYNEVYVRTDILKYEGNGKWSITEVKSSTKVKDEHLDDVAIQYYCANGTGLDISSIRVQHINPLCVYPDLDQLFWVNDVTEQVLDMQNEIPNNVWVLKRIGDENQPVRGIGSHCDKPYECLYKDQCWKHVPEQSIFTIPRLSWQKKEELISENVLAIQDVPRTAKLSEKQKTYLHKFKTGTQFVNLEAVFDKLHKLTYPIHFLDFETDFQAIPHLEGASPYNQIPFQYSCHIADHRGHVRHAEYLHTSQSDPRLGFITHLLQNIGRTGSIVAYNAKFEMRVLMTVADHYPELKTKIRKLIPRFWDLMDIFKEDYFHPGFNGSYSMKAVLPIIAPELSYSNLDEVHDGTEAGIVWNQALVEPDREKRERSFANLRAYCKRDTEGMVVIHNHLLGMLN